MPHYELQSLLSDGKTGYQHKQEFSEIITIIVGDIKMGCKEVSYHYQVTSLKKHPKFGSFDLKIS